ncbi:hypothetical protein AZE42_00801, partial [Rhizopogon vesiculosus]
AAPEAAAEAAPVEAPKEDKKEKENRAAKVGRRLSARVGELFKSKTKEVSPPAKVDEHPPKIDEPAPVAPLEDPASSEAAAPVVEDVPAEPAPVVAPMVAATA